MKSIDKVGVVGLGYVGLPLAISLSRKFPVIGFDVSERRISTLRSGVDYTGEITSEELALSSISITDDSERLRGCSVFVVTVPTPVDASRQPDFSHLCDACTIIGKIMDRGAIVVFESTVYPGATEEICLPVLEEVSGMKGGEDFFVGYSPERINPGDKQHPLEKIVKVVSGQDEQTVEALATLYGSIIEAGVHKASSIKVAEAAKVIENTQRDINIALMNEISKICHLVGIRTSEVLEAAGTKWNFLKFYPGLVGGHCIGVDPYYLTAKAEQLGYHPEVILSGRRINDGMGSYIAQRAVKMLAAGERTLRNARVGILGLTFKENVPDIRNSKVEDIYAELIDFGIFPLVHDPLADRDASRREFGIELTDIASFVDLDMLIYAVSHDEYGALGASGVEAMLADRAGLIDVKSSLDPTSLRSDIQYLSL